MHKCCEKFIHNFWKNSGKKMIIIENDSCGKALNMSEKWKRNKDEDYTFSIWTYIKSI